MSFSGFHHVLKGIKRVFLLLYTFREERYSYTNISIEAFPHSPAQIQWGRKPMMKICRSSCSCESMCQYDWPPSLVPIHSGRMPGTHCLHMHIISSNLCNGLVLQSLHNDYHHTAFLSICFICTSETANVLQLP